MLRFGAPKASASFPSCNTMYNGYQSPQFTNNPFISDSTNAQSRFPDISGSASPEPNASQFTSWMQPGGSQQLQQQQYQQQMPSQFTGTGVGYNPTGNGFGSQQPQFQPSSEFGQQMVGQISGTSYGYLQGQQSPSSSQIYNPVQQQLQSPSYSAAAQFDPLVQGWSNNTPSSNQQPQLSSFAAAPMSPTSSITTSRSATGAVHPREYIKTYKAEIERWDSYAWKQFLNSYDDLKEAWANRKQEVNGRAQQLLTQMQYGGGGYYPQMQQEAERLQGVRLLSYPKTILSLNFLFCKSSRRKLI